MVNVLGIFGQKQITIFGISIAYYAICILIGAITAYKLSQHFLKKRGYDPEAIETLFYIAFPAGIIGARLWWVIAEGAWDRWWAIHEGGLAIQGGVLLGALVGIIYMRTKRKNIPILTAVDCIVPNILIAQAIGRWGNFFNQEVYGHCVDRWTWLPDFLENRFVYQVNNDGYTKIPLCDTADQMVVPLCFIEGLLNVAGFFLIVFAIPAISKLISKKFNSKYTIANGTLMGAYFTWYGIVRAILEPLRNSDYTMGSTDGVNNLISVYMSIAFIVLGIAIIVLCHVFRDKFQKPVLDTNVIDEVKDDKVEENNERN